MAGWIKWGLGLVGAIIISPFVFLAIKGIVGLAIAAAIGMLIINLAPILSMKLANMKMKAIVAEAQANPIETMNNVYLEKSRIIQDKDRKIVQFEGRLGDYADKLEGFKERFPERAPKFEEVEKTMRRGLERMKRKQVAAKKAQAIYKAKIEEAEAIYEMAKAAREVTELSADIEQQVFMDIKQQVSFDAVNHEFNSAVAELSLEVDNDQDFTAGDTIKTVDMAVEPFPVDGQRVGTRHRTKEGS